MHSDVFGESMGAVGGPWRSKIVNAVGGPWRRKIVNAIGGSWRRKSDCSV